MNNELYHFGIKGMKWGVRRSPEQLGHKRKNKKKISQRRLKTQALNRSGFRNSKALSRARSKDINGMTNDQLKKTNERLRLEKEYRQLTSIDTGRGRAWVNDALTYGGWAIASYAFIRKHLR